MALAVVVRSAPIALGIGIAWSGPIEHLVQDAWSGAGDWFPGLLLEGLSGRGSVDAGAAVLVAGYVALAAVAGALTLQRRDLAG